MRFCNNFGHSMFFLTNFRPTDYVALCMYGVGWSGVEWSGVEWSGVGWGGLG